MHILQISLNFPPLAKYLCYFITCNYCLSFCSSSWEQLQRKGECKCSSGTRLTEGKQINFWGTWPWYYFRDHIQRKIWAVRPEIDCDWACCLSDVLWLRAKIGEIFNTMLKGLPAKISEKLGSEATEWLEKCTGPNNCLFLSAIPQCKDDFCCGSLMAFEVA